MKLKIGSKLLSSKYEKWKTKRTPTKFGWITLAFELHFFWEAIWVKTVEEHAKMNLTLSIHFFYCFHSSSVARQFNRSTHRRQELHFINGQLMIRHAIMGCVSECKPISLLFISLSKAWLDRMKQITEHRKW